MNPTDSTAATQLALERLSDHLFHEMAYYVFGILAMFMLKSFIEEIIAGVIWKFRSGYHEDDIVWIGNVECRIVKLGLISTKFTEFLKDGEGRIIGGFSRILLNETLRDAYIKKPLPMAELPTKLRTVERE